MDRLTRGDKGLPSLKPMMASATPAAPVAMTGSSGTRAARVAAQRLRAPLRHLLDANLPLALGWLAAIVVISAHEPLIGLLVILGFGGAFVSGLAGIGGGVVMIPLLLFVPQLFGFAPIDVRTVTGITAVQVATAALSGLGGHLSTGRFNSSLFVLIGVPMTCASLSGAVFSKAVDPNVLKLVFAIMAIAAAILLLVLKPEAQAGVQDMTPRGRALAALSGLVIGFPAGMVGVGGAFLEIPVLVYGLKVDMRIAVGTALGIVGMSGTAGLVGKAATGQVDWLLSLGLVAGALPAGRLGAVASHRVPVRGLSIILGILVAMAAARVLIS